METGETASRLVVCVLVCVGWRALVSDNARSVSSSSIDRLLPALYVTRSLSVCYGCVA